MRGWYIKLLLERSKYSLIFKSTRLTGYSMIITSLLFNGIWFFYRTVSVACACFLYTVTYGSCYSVSLLVEIDISKVFSSREDLAH